ncbi:MAG: 30S ribosomal protein S15 [Gammaproteobacteria bacterium]
MSITTAEKAAIVKEFGGNEANTGATPVQVALLSKRINSLQEHFAGNKGDNHSRRGLLKMVSQRKRLLKYLKRTNLDGYRALIKALGLRDK